MAKQCDVWRRVGGQVIQCTGCQMNSEHVLANETPVGVEYSCDAPNHVCVFLNYPIDNDKWYSNFRGAYNDGPNPEAET